MFPIAMAIEKQSCKELHAECGFYLANAFKLINDLVWGKKNNEHSFFLSMAHNK